MAKQLKQCKDCLYCAKGTTGLGKEVEICTKHKDVALKLRNDEKSCGLHASDFVLRTGVRMILNSGIC